MKTVLFTISTLFITILSYGQTLSTGQLDFGTQNISLLANVDTNTDIVTLTITGPLARWFGIGFNSSAMNGTYTIISEENGGPISERILGFHSSGSAIGNSEIIVTSDTNNNDETIRTIILTRPRNAMDASAYDFPTTDGSSTNIIWGYGPNGGSFSTATIMGGHSPGGVSITFNNTLSIEDFNNTLSKTVVYPNPSNGTFSFENARDLNTIQVFNMLGEKLKVIDYRSQNSNAIELSDLNAGVYSLLLIGEQNQKAIKRVILQ